jgi:hypothetical protein
VDVQLAVDPRAEHRDADRLAALDEGDVGDECPVEDRLDHRPVVAALFRAATHPDPFWRSGAGARSSSIGLSLSNIEVRDLVVVEGNDVCDSAVGLGIQQQLVEYTPLLSTSGARPARTRTMTQSQGNAARRLARVEGLPERDRDRVKVLAH